MKNIVETAVEAGSFKTLVKAVQAAGLVETLSKQGPFTVFAPTDDANGSSHKLFPNVVRTAATTIVSRGTHKSASVKGSAMSFRMVAFGCRNIPCTSEEKCAPTS